MPPLPVAPAGAAPVPAPTTPAPRGAFAAALERRAGLIHATSSPPRSSPPATPGGPHPALSALAGLERAQARLDGVVAAARAGRTFTAAELLALQAEAYRCTQTVDLAAKLVEQGAQAVKHALNTQL